MVAQCALCVCRVGGGAWSCGKGRSGDTGIPGSSPAGGRLAVPG